MKGVKSKEEVSLKRSAKSTFVEVLNQALNALDQADLSVIREHGKS
ncbi:MAG: hypothetical protein MI748_12240 [Opitutales bacterium]|nr:hypothetical protein [Opitutales bacterium]